MGAPGTASWCLAALAATISFSAQTLQAPECCAAVWQAVRIPGRIGGRGRNRQCRQKGDGEVSGEGESSLSLGVNKCPLAGDTEQGLSLLQS